MRGYVAMVFGEAECLPSVLQNAAIHAFLDCSSGMVRSRVERNRVCLGGLRSS